MPHNPEAGRASPAQSPRLDQLEARLLDLSALIASVRARPGIGLSEQDKQQLHEQAGRVAAAARYFLIGP